MTEMKHTPGPWSFEPHGNTVALYSGRSRGMNGRHGLRLMNLDDGDSNFEANARLIAAAPDLHDALKALVASVFSPNEEGSPTLSAASEMALAALNKAEGRQP